MPSRARSALLDDLIQVLPAWQLSAMRFNDAVAHRLGIVSSDLQCLFVLDRLGPRSPGVIAQDVGLTTGSTSRMVERLVTAGLVTRTADPHDRRRVVVAIRPAASRRLHALYDPLDDDLRAVLENHTSGTLEHLGRFATDALTVTTRRTASL